MGLKEAAHEAALTRQADLIAAGQEPMTNDEFEQLVFDIYHDTLAEDYRASMEDQFYEEALNCHG